MNKIRLNNVQIYAYHGLLPEEKQLGQKFQIDVELSADFNKACISDDIADTVNYERILEIINLTFKNFNKNLIESVANKIAEKILLLDKVIDVLIKIRKPSVPINGICDSVEVIIFRKKNELKYFSFSRFKSWE